MDIDKNNNRASMIKVKEGKMTKTKKEKDGQTLEEALIEEGKELLFDFSGWVRMPNGELKEVVGAVIRLVPQLEIPDEKGTIILGPETKIYF